MLKIIPLVVLAATSFAEPSELVDSLDTADSAKPAYRNPSLPTEVRVKDLLSRMTVDEKLAQLGKLQAFRAYDRVDGHIVLKPDAVEGIATNCPGTAYGVLRADWWTGRNWNTGVAPEMAVEAINAFQRIAVD